MTTKDKINQLLDEIEDRPAIWSLCKEIVGEMEEKIIPWNVNAPVPPKDGVDKNINGGWKMGSGWIWINQKGNPSVWLCIDQVDGVWLRIFGSGED